MSEIQEFIISWTGKIVFSASSITEQQYNNYFDTNAITYSIANKTLAFYCGTPCALPVDYLNPVGQKEVINRVAYGKKWLGAKTYNDLPDFSKTILCRNGEDSIDFEQLPYKAKRHIAETIVSKGEHEGSLCISM